MDNDLEQLMTVEYLEGCCQLSLDCGEMDIFGENAYLLVEMYRGYNTRQSIEIHCLYLLFLLVKEKSVEFHSHLEMIHTQHLQNAMLSTVL